MVSEPRLIKLIRGLKSLVNRVVRPFRTKFSKKTYDQRQHVVVNALRVRHGWTYREAAEFLAVMPVVREELGLASVPHWTTVQKAYERLKGVVWETLLQLSSRSEGFASIDASGFQRGYASHHYARVRVCG